MIKFNKILKAKQSRANDVNVDLLVIILAWRKTIDIIGDNIYNNFSIWICIISVME